MRLPASALVLSCVLACLSGGCSHELGGPAPTIAQAVTPHLVCNAQITTRVAIAGSGFSPMPVDTATSKPKLELPKVTVTQSADLTGAPTDMATPVVIPDDPADPSSSQVHWTSQSLMTFDVTPGLALPTGYHRLDVQNPNGHGTRFDSALAVVPPPTLDTINPMAICVDQGDQMLQLAGSGFLRIADASGARVPSIDLRDASGMVVKTYMPDSLDDCTTLMQPAADTETCKTMALTIPMGDVPPGTYSVVVTNPAPANCASTDAVSVQVVPPPTLASVTPTQICSGGGSIGLTGMNFSEMPGVTVSLSNATDSADAGSVNVDAGGMSATSTFGPVNPGTYSITLTNPEGCSDTLDNVITVISGPIMFFVDPPVVYSGISTQVTIYISGATSVSDVSIVPMGGGSPIMLDAMYDAARGRIQATVPAGTAAGTYDVHASSGGCDTVLPGGLRVTDTMGLTVSSIDPTFGYNGSDTAVSIFGTGFVSTPRAYLNPSMPTSTTVATALASVGFVDGTRLTGVVPSGLPVGSYDLIVVNPSGEVGVLSDAFTVTDAPPPVIDEVAPGEVTNDAATTVNASGSGFAGPTVTWRCKLPDGSSMDLMSSVASSDATSAVVDFDPTSLPDKTVCVLRLTNPDGSYGEFSAVSVTAPSSNLAATVAATDMTTGRRGLSAVSGRATRAARFLFALGGDDGTDAGVLDTSEAAPVDPFGALGAWVADPNGMPEGLSRAGAWRIGRYIYVVGGYDGGSAVGDVWRTEILDPLAAPKIEDISVDPLAAMATSGIGPGVWYYRVSAVFPSSDPDNPGGESLASDPLVVDLPASLPRHLDITLYWSSVPGASQYEIYRSPTPDMGSGMVELLDTVDASMTSYQDTGGTTTSGRVPLPLGAHGTWAVMPSLGTPRAGLGVGHAQDPSDPSIHYLYAVDGEDASGALLDSYEVFRIDVASDGTQTPAASWTAGTETLSWPARVGMGTVDDPRDNFGIYSVDSHSAPRSISDSSAWIYVVGGVGGTGSALPSAAAALVQAGGQLGAFQAIDNLSPHNAGFANMTGNNFLYEFGGGPSPSAAAASAQVCSGGSLRHRAQHRQLEQPGLQSPGEPLSPRGCHRERPCVHPGWHERQRCPRVHRIDGLVRRMVMRTLRAAIASVLVLATSFGSGHAMAQDSGPQDFRHKTLTLGLRAGVLVPSVFNQLGVGPDLTFEVGLLLPVADKRLAIVADGSYASAGRSGGGTHPRIGDMGGPWTFHMTTQEALVSIGPVFRFLPPGSTFVPYVGAFGRLFMMKTTADGTGGGQAFGQNTEQSTEIGFAAALGGELRLGPGTALLELGFQWAKLDQRITGDVGATALSAQIGYRLFL